MTYCSPHWSSDSVLFWERLRLRCPYGKMCGRRGLAKRRLTGCDILNLAVHVRFLVINDIVLLQPCSSDPIRKSSVEVSNRLQSVNMLLIQFAKHFWHFALALFMVQPFSKASSPTSGKLTHWPIFPQKNYNQYLFSRFSNSVSSPVLSFWNVFFSSRNDHEWKQ